MRKYIILALFAVLAISLLLYQGQGSRQSEYNTCVRPKGYILIIMSSTGFNDSASMLSKHENWPVITVNKGQVVNILVCNLDSVSSHGFAIDGYFDSGIVLRPMQSYSLSFIATKAGNFTIYCNVFCPVHWAMLRGLLVVK